MRTVERILKIVLAALGAYVGAQVLLRLYRRLLPFPVPPAVDRLLDSPVRELGMPRRDTLQHIGLRAGLNALEIGAGAGYLTADAARMVGPEGRLTAIDVQRPMVALLKGRLRHEDLPNLDIQVADVYHLPFADDSFDLAFVVSTLGQLQDKGRALREVRRVLKPGGRLAVTEVMSDPSYMLMVEVVEWAQSVGFQLLEQHGNAFQYTLSFRLLFE